MILALDLSSKSTGWSLFRNTELINSGCLVSPYSQYLKRIEDIITQIDSLLQLNPDINVIVAEEVRQENEIKNIHTYKVLMYLQGALELLIYKKYKNIHIKYMYPSEWRKSCGIRTGRGIKREALKQADIDFVKEKFNKKVNDDEADAIGIGFAYTVNLDENCIWT